MNLRRGGRVLKAAVYGWIADRAGSMGAAIAFYTIFSLAPLLILVIAIAGFAFGEEAARGAIVGQLDGLLGRQGALAVQALIESADRPMVGLVATFVGLGTLLLGATAVFAELQAALNIIWKAKPRPGSTVMSVIRARLLSLSLVLALGFLLMVSLVLSALLAAFGDYLTRLLPGLDVVLRLLNQVVSFAVITTLFALIYKILPDVPLTWRDVWGGAAVTALLFTVGKFAIGLYIGSSDIASTYGAAGALIVILLWVYYSAQIVLFGAELARAWRETSDARPGDARTEE